MINFVIKVSNLVKFFDERQIIKDISFSISEKETSRTGCSNSPASSTKGSNTKRYSLKHHYLNNNGLYGINYDAYRMEN